MAQITQPVVSFQALVTSTGLNSAYGTFTTAINTNSTAIDAATNANTGGTLVKRDINGGTQVTYLGIPVSGSFSGVNVQAIAGYTGIPFSYSVGGIGRLTVNNDGSITTAAGFKGKADSAKSADAVPLANVQDFGASFNIPVSDGTKFVSQVFSSAIVPRGTIPSDRISDCWWTQSPLGGLRVRVAPGNIWMAGTPIFFPAKDSPVLDISDVASGESILALLYIDASGSLQWQRGDHSPNPGLPSNPSGNFVPIGYVKSYHIDPANIATATFSSYGPVDPGTGAFFYQRTFMFTTPVLASAIGAHSLPITRLMDASVYATTPNASISVVIAKFSFWNSLNQQVEFPTSGAATTQYTYTNPDLLNASPRWDLLYVDDNGNLGKTNGTLSPLTKPSFVVGQWPLAEIYIPVGCTSIVDEVNYTAAPGQGYIHYVPAYMASNAPSSALVTATGTITTSGTAPNIVVTGVTVTNGGGPYSSPPSVVFIGGTGTPASAVSNMSVTAGVVSSVTMLSGGAYSVAPTGVSFTTTTGITPVALGGTGANAAGAARTNLGAAASGTNTDITVLNAMTSITAPAGSLSITGNTTVIPFTAAGVPLNLNGVAGQTADLLTMRVASGSPISSISKDGFIGIGTAALAQQGIRQMGFPTGNNVYGYLQAFTSTLGALKLSAGATNVAAFTTVGSYPTYLGNPAGNALIDLTSLTAGQNVPYTYGAYIAPYQRLNAASYSEVYCVQNINRTGTVTGGTYTLSDGTHTTASINVTALNGDFDSPAAGTINAALAAASITYRSTGGPITSATIVLTATQPGIGTVLTLTPSGITGGGSISIALTGTVGKPGILSAQGLKIYKPDKLAGVSTLGLSVSGYLDDAGTQIYGSANQYLAHIYNFGGVSNSAANYQKNALGVYYLQQDGFSTWLRDGTYTVALERDAVAMDVQAWIDDGTAGGVAVTNGFIWAMHLQTSVGYGLAGGGGYRNPPVGSPGNSVIIEAQVINHGQYDSGRLQDTPVNSRTAPVSITGGVGISLHQIGINMVAQGPTPTTAAFVISSSGFGGGLSNGYWHQGLYGQSGSIGPAITDSFIEYYNTYRVGPDGRTSIGSPGAGDTSFMLKVAGEIQGGQIADRTALNIFGRASVTADMVVFDAAPFGANAQAIKVDRAGHLYATAYSPSLPPLVTVTPGGSGQTYPSAGASATVTITGTDQSGLIKIQPGAGSVVGNLASISFRNTYTRAPESVVITPNSLAAANAIANIFPVALSASGFYLYSNISLTNGGAYWFFYHVF